MSDVKTRRGCRDRSRVNLGEDCEVLRRAKMSGVQPDELRAAMKGVDNEAAAVAARSKGKQ